MLYLATGTPGAGKTLNTIKWINEDDRFKEIAKGKEEPKLRQVYYYGIAQLDESFGWIEMKDAAPVSTVESAVGDNVVSIQSDDNEEPAPDPLKWYELPSGSVIVFDEAYNIFPTRHGSKQPPEHVKLLATHRHKGYDIVMICQKVTGQLDSFIRGLVNHHQNYVRVFGSNTVMRFSWDLCQDNPNSASAKQSAVVTTMRYDKKYFGSYHSADEHTAKVSLPWKQIIFLGVGVTASVVIAIFFYNRVYGRVEEAQILEPVSEVTEYRNDSALVRPTGRRRDSEDLTFIERHTPEVQGLPWTAPIYDEVTQAQSWPRPAACIVRVETGDCTCHTQQATILAVSDDFCNLMVKNGFFDWTKEDLARSDDRLRGGGGEGSASQTATTSQMVSQNASSFQYQF